MPSSVKEMLTEANAAVPRLNPAQVRDMIGKENVLIVDVRDAPELGPAERARAVPRRHAYELRRRHRGEAIVQRARLREDIERRVRRERVGAERGLDTRFLVIVGDKDPGLDAAAMQATLAAIVVELAEGTGPGWLPWASLALALAPIALAASRTVPTAVRLGTRRDPVGVQSTLARRLLAEHLFCFISIACLIAVQLGWG